MIILLLTIPLILTQENTIIGIDLGTTYSSVGIFRNGKVEMIPNEYGSITTPTIVAILNDEFIVGEDAKNQAMLNPQNTFYNVKRIIGKRYQDYSVNLQMKNVPYTIVKNENRPYIQVSEYKGERLKLFSPEYIQAKVVSKMKRIAEDYLGFQVKKAVISVPATFNDAQKQATKDIGIIADLEVVSIITESKAAALAYGINYDQEKKNIFIIDFGGGTLDISVIAISEYIFEDIMHSGDSYLGGEDFDENLVNYFVNKIQASHNIDLRNNTNAIQKLKIEAQRAKEALSEKTQVNIIIQDLVKGFNFNLNINRDEFEQLNKKLFYRIQTVLTTAQEESKLFKEDIDEVVLAGGSSRIPKVQEIIQEFFLGIPIRKERIKDELICAGAVIRGGIISKQKPYSFIQIIEVERTSISFGIETAGGYMSKIIPKNTIFPTKLSQIYTTLHDYQTEVLISIYQGDEYKTVDNYKIGQFILSGIQNAKKNIPQIEVTFELDLNGILDVKAIDLNTQSQERQLFTINTMRPSKEEILQERENNLKEQKQQQEKQKEKLLKQRESIIAAFDQFIQKYKEQFQSPHFKNFFSKYELDSMYSQISDSQEWLQKNRLNKNILNQEFEEKLQNLKNKIVSKVKQKMDL